MKKNALICILSLVFLGSMEANAAFLESDKAVLRGVDKITGRVQTIELSVGSLGKFGNLTVYVEKCLTRPPEETPEDASFLMITEPKGQNDHQVVFNGWMFSSNPAVSAMEHPIYDIWVLSCPADETARLTQLSEDKEAHQKVLNENNPSVKEGDFTDELSDIEKEMLARTQSQIKFMQELKGISSEPEKNVLTPNLNKNIIPDVLIEELPKESINGTL